MVQPRDVEPAKFPAQASLADSEPVSGWSPTAGTKEVSLVDSELVLSLSPTACSAMWSNHGLLMFSEEILQQVIRLLFGMYLV